MDLLMYRLYWLSCRRWNCRFVLKAAGWYLATIGKSPSGLQRSREGHQDNFQISQIIQIETMCRNISNGVTLYGTKLYNGEIIFQNCRIYVVEWVMINGKMILHELEYWNSQNIYFAQLNTLGHGCSLDESAIAGKQKLFHILGPGRKTETKFSAQYLLHSNMFGNFLDLPDRTQVWIITSHQRSTSPTYQGNARLL